MRLLIYLPALLILFTSCELSQRQTNQEQQVTKTDSAQIIVDKAIAAHGGNKLIGTTIEFDFRKRHYSAIRNMDRYVYTQTFDDDSLGYIQDTLVNSTGFIRYRDDELQSIDEEWQGRYGNTINSILYFTQLPYGLNDAAVIKKYLGEVTIGNQPYHKVQVTFRKEGGGEDFDDIYIYWIHRDDYTLDFLGYEFSVNGGGTRFRKAIDRQVIEGITFQNYINYKAEDKDTPIRRHDALFNQGELIELSRIINTDLAVKEN
jgi:hypothetical protein